MMKILFICGSLEPGKDGVGDYTRRLGGELYRQGHQVSIIALNDRHIREKFAITQMAEGAELPVLRLPSTQSSKNRFAHAKQWIDAFAPDWISLQFVPFSFQKKGLPFGLASNLKRIARKSKVHIMFHELWVGLYGKQTLNSLLLSILQKSVINQLIKKLTPSLITTSIPLYRGGLAKYNAVILPLFGNIPLCYTNSKAYMAGRTNDEHLVAIHFGRFTHSLLDLKKQIEYFSTIAKANQKKATFIAIGNGGIFTSEAVDIAKKILSASAVIITGKIESEEISKYMSMADIGISRSDFPLIGKSGTTIAMIEHGLPVLLRGNRPKNCVSSYTDKITSRTFFCEDDISQIPTKTHGRSFLGEIANDFIKLLNTDHTKQSVNLFINLY